MSLTEFLLARIAEDEEWAMTSASTSTPGSFVRDNYGALLIQPTRVLAECEAKRQIVDQWLCRYDDNPRHVDHETLDARDTLHAIALPYAGHPDYRTDWKP